MPRRLYTGEEKYDIIMESFQNPNITIAEIYREHGIAVSLFPDEDYAMKLSYLKSIEFNSKHEFRKMNGSFKFHDEIKEMFNRRYPL